MNKAVKKTISWVVYLLILAGLIWGIPRGLSYVLRTDYPMASITSGSMWPSLKQGDLVFIKGYVDKEDVQKGDIIVYKNYIGFTIHRVVELNEYTVTTKGDANRGPDSPIEYDDIVGKAVSYNGKPIRVPLIGNISILINKNI